MIISESKIEKNFGLSSNKTASYEWPISHYYSFLKGSYKHSCFFFYIQEFLGNTDQDTVVRHRLYSGIRARYIRFRPTAWHSHISMRVEVYGCKGNSIGINYNIFFRQNSKWLLQLYLPVEAMTFT